MKIHRYGNTPHLSLRAMHWLPLASTGLGVFSLEKEKDWDLDGT